MSNVRARGIRPTTLEQKKFSAVDRSALQSRMGADRRTVASLIEGRPVHRSTLKLALLTVDCLRAEAKAGP